MAKNTKLRIPENAKKEAVKKAAKYNPETWAEEWARTQKEKVQKDEVTEPAGDGEPAGE